MLISEKIIKRSFLVFNCVFVLTGILFISSGVGVQNQYDKYGAFIDERYYAQTILFVACGALTFFNAIFGFVGAVKKNYCLILTFGGLLILLSLLTITAGIIGFVLYKDSTWLMEQNLKNSMTTYLEGNREVQKSYDELQKEFSCCGSTGFNDWADLIEKKYNKTELPVSCCRNVGKMGITECGFHWISNGFEQRRRVVDYKQVFYPGCYQLSYFISGHAHALGIVGFVFAGVQILGLVLTFLIARQFKN